MIGDPRFHPYNLAPAPKRVRFRVDYPKHKDHRFDKLYWLAASAALGVGVGLAFVYATLK